MSSPTDTAPLLISVKAAAARLGMRIDEVYDLVQAGDIKCIQRVKGAKIHIPEAELVRFVAENAKPLKGDVA